jgi:hypothetical protein
MWSKLQLFQQDPEKLQTMAQIRSNQIIESFTMINLHKNYVKYYKTLLLIKLQA